MFWRCFLAAIVFTAIGYVMRGFWSFDIETKRFTRFDSEKQAPEPPEEA